MSVLVLTVLAGCSSWIDQEPACEYDVYDWSDDVLSHILAGDGSGAFDFDPDDVPRKSLKGEYDPATGDYAWSEAYADDYWLVKAEITGFGTAFHNGNLDVKHTASYIDILANAWAKEWRVQRTGCDVTSSSWPEGDETSALTISGSYDSDDSFTWSADVPGYSTFKGGMRRNLSRTQTVEAEDGSWSSYTESKPEGYSDTEFTQSCGTGYTCEGTWRDRFDGGSDGSGHAVDDGSGEKVVDFSWDYAYNGDGEYVETYTDGTSCTYTYTESGQSCSLACSDGSTGRC